MCGIAALARTDGGHLDDSADQLLKRMATILAHRGPDATELLREDAVGFAFTRLALVGPDDGGQPLVSDDGSLVLIANGEVYNHRELAASLPAGTRLRSGSDCEVLLYLYREHGLSFLDRVRGMFGLILWDRRRQHLVLARDRFGIKPLYFHRNAHRIVLGSEIKSLFADPATPRRLDWERTLTNSRLAVAPQIAPTPLATWFDEVESVPAATIMRIDLRDGTTREHTYWRLPEVAADLAVEDVVGSYRELFDASVRECATADAELGVFLSGGIDSAAVAALGKQQAGELHCFTVLNAGTHRNGDAEHAHRLAAQLGLPNHQVLFDPGRVPGVAEWKRLLWLVENPMCGAEFYYKHELHRYAKAARPELRGMLLGAASDEFNGGYSVTYAGSDEFPAEAGWDTFTGNLRAMVRLGQLRERPDLSPWWTAGGAPLLTDAVIERYAGQTAPDPYLGYLEWEYGKLQQYNCWIEDRAAAGSGIEARVPFLDHRLVELVAALPAPARPRLLWDKRILREAMRGLLPEEVRTRPKVPFFYGDGQHHTYRMLVRMLAQDGMALLEEAVAAPGADEFIDAPAVRAALREVTAEPDTARVEILLRVINLGLLAGMAADLPLPTVLTPIGDPPESVSVSRWDAQLERLVGLRPDLPLDGVPQLSERVLVLSDREQICYLAVDGSIEYVLDQDTPEWLAFVRAIDGTRRISEILAEIRADADQVAPLLAQLTGQGLISVARCIGPKTG